MESQKGNSGEAENNVGVGGSSGGGNNTSSGSRWNPTKEQISMLENLYKQGIRTPSAEQIEQITARLRAYGQIEGKNVFYWFQNHKARQRQRQKQQQLQSNNNAFFNRFLHTPHPPPFSSPLCQNVVCTPSPFCLPQSDFGFYPQPPNMLVTGPISPRAENVGGPMMVVMPRMYDGRPIYDPWQQRIPDYSICHSNPKTLDLFPQHPTGTMEEGKTTEHVVSAENQPCFDFFTLGKGPRFTD